MKIALYNKYRPEGFNDLFGQDHIATTIKNAIKDKSFAHAYLFTGPRGVGKTSAARILAKAINCEKNFGSSPQGRAIKNSGEPCGSCQPCKSIAEGREIDVIEIDAASNRGIDEIRELREKIKFAPSKLGYKVFIIDEVHMLTKEAFNALLKTLEEPPAHAVFVLATTEIHKIPQTVISRCQRFDFRRIKISDLLERLKYIAKNEKIKIDDNALSLIAESSEGGFRDAISYLDQISSYKEGEINIDDVILILGMTDFLTLFKFTAFIKEGKSKEAIILINDLAENGYDLEQFTKNLLEFLRKLMLVCAVGSDEVELSAEHSEKMKELCQGFSIDRISNFIQTISENNKLLQGNSIPQLPLELSVVKVVGGGESMQAPLDEEKDEILREAQNDEDSGQVRMTKKENEEILQEIQNDSVKAQNDEDSGQARMTKEENDEILREAQNKGEQVQKNKITGKPVNRSADNPVSHTDHLWDDFLIELKSRNTSLHAFIKVSEPAFSEEELILSFPYKFHKDRVSGDKANKKLVEETAYVVYNKPYKLKCILKETSERKAEKEEKDELVNSALEIFGGEIVE